MGGGVSVCKSSSLPLPPPHTFPLLQHQSSLQAAVFQDIPVWASHKLQFLQGMSPCWFWHGPLHRLQAIPAPQTSSSWAAGESLLQHPDHLLPSLFSGVCVIRIKQIPPTLQMSLAVSCGGSVAQLYGISRAQHRGSTGASFDRVHLCTLPCCQRLGTSLNMSFKTLVLFC